MESNSSCELGSTYAAVSVSITQLLPSSRIYLGQLRSTTLEKVRRNRLGFRRDSQVGQNIKGASTKDKRGKENSRRRHALHEWFEFASFTRHAIVNGHILHECERHGSTQTGQDEDCLSTLVSNRRSGSTARGVA